MSLTPNRRRRSAPAGQMRPVRWTVWELALLTVSLVLIASPLLAAGYALIAPPAAPAAPAALAWPTAQPTTCPDGPCPPPTFTALPPATNTPLPTATSTPEPTPAITATPAPTRPPCGEGYPIPCDSACYDSTGYPIPCVSPTPTATAAPTATEAPTATAAPTATEAPTATAAPTAIPAPTSPPPPTQTLGVFKEALGLNGQVIATSSVGAEFLYSIRVDNAVAVAVPIRLDDTFPAGIDGVSLASVNNGTCSITARSLSCTMQPSQNKSATVLFRVRVTGPAGISIANVAQAVNTGSGESTSATAGVVMIGGGSVAQPATPAPTSPPATPLPTAKPATPLPTAKPATPLPAKPGSPQPANPAPTAPPASEPSTPEPAASQPAPPATEPAPPTSEPAAPAAAPTVAVEPTAAPPSAAVPAPTAPPQQPPAPTQQPAPSPTKPAVSKQAAPSSTAQPAATNMPVPSGTAQPGATSSPAPTATLGPTMAPVMTPAPNQPALRFNLNSDWGQVFVGDTFEYVITLQNVGNAAGGTSPFTPRERKVRLEQTLDVPAINDVVISDELNPLFEIVSVTASGMKVTTKDQKVEAVRASLAGGEMATVKIKVRARPIDANAKMILNQATVSYKDASEALFSNIVAVKVVTKSVPTATAAPTTAPTATAAPPLKAENPAATLEPFGEKAELPHTSGGAPVWGVVLLGLTMLLHSIRVHRARVRI